MKQEGRYAVLRPGYAVLVALGLLVLLCCRTASAADALARPHFVVTTSSPDQVTRGQQAIVKLLVLPRGGWHINKQFPTSLKLSAPPGVTLAKPHLRAADASKLAESEIRFEAAFSASAPGTAKLSGELRFAVCDAKACEPNTVPVNWTVAVR